MSIFENVTRAELKDCFIDKNDNLVFIVREDQIGKAIGKQGTNVKRLKQLLNRKIKIVEFNSNLIQFIKNLVYPLTLKEIRDDDGIVILVGNDTKTRGLLIGREAQNLRSLETTVRRYFTVEEIKVE
jgi:N utilization substance protein A